MLVNFCLFQRSWEISSKKPLSVVHTFSEQIWGCLYTFRLIKIQTSPLDNLYTNVLRASGERVGSIGRPNVPFVGVRYLLVSKPAEVTGHSQLQCSSCRYNDKSERLNSVKGDAVRPTPENIDIQL